MTVDSCGERCAQLDDFKWFLPTKLAVAPQAAYEVVQPRPRDYGYTDSLPPGSGCLDSPRIDTPEAAVSSMEMAGGSPPAEINISRSPDRLQTELSVATTEMAG